MLSRVEISGRIAMLFRNFEMQVQVTAFCTRTGSASQKSLRLCLEFLPLTVLGPRAWDTTIADYSM